MPRGRNRANGQPAPPKTGAGAVYHDVSEEKGDGKASKARLSQIGATLEALAATIAARRDADEASYTYRLLTGNVDDVLKKVMEESGRWPRRQGRRRLATSSPQPPWR